MEIERLRESILHKAFRGGLIIVIDTKNCFILDYE
ncbi:MAG: hypothetical protein KIIPBIDF_01904 [Candidatus Methanoperedenaceae archaeon GB50]|nr:MAG: hypothetical protein KIIPBIDF_01904 [Candidatus Methanoperedenaceae archaeon GB50]